MDGSLTLHARGSLADELIADLRHLDTLVCGGRDYNDARRVYSILTALSPARIIEGGQTGADTQAREWAIVNYVPFRTFDADWKKLGPAAGPIRNNEMLIEGKPALVVAFPGNRGTANMVNQARTAGIPVLEISR